MKNLLGGDDASKQFFRGCPLGVEALESVKLTGSEEQLLNQVQLYLTSQLAVKGYSMKQASTMHVSNEQY